MPTGVAAVAIEPASTGDVTVFALSLAITRLFLALRQRPRGRLEGDPARADRVAYLISAGLFLVSIWVPEPFRYALWVIGIAQESGAMLHDDRQAARRAREEHDFALFKPENPKDALDPHHFAERFGLFLIILLGEVVVEAGQASVDGHVASFDGWMALVAAMILAAALWWLYFDSAADRNLRVLELSGGSPTMAKALYAVGHMFPSFALLLVAAGVGLLLEGDPPRLAYRCRRSASASTCWAPACSSPRGRTARAPCADPARRHLLARPAARDALAARVSVAAERGRGRLRRALDARS